VSLLEIELANVLLKETDGHSTVISRQPLFTRALAKIVVAPFRLWSDFAHM